MPGFLKIKAPNPSLLAVFGVGLLGFIVVSTVWGFRHWPPRQVEIERELNQIAPPQGATTTQHVVAYKWTSGTIGNYYRVDLTYEQIRAHYDKELASHGWKFKAMIPLTSWGKDLGESQTVYCRGNHAADIYFTGNAQSSYRYALNITWGFSDCD